MRPVFICQKIGQVRTALKAISGRTSYISLVDNWDSIEVRDYLNSRSDTEELSRTHLLRERSQGFREKYIEFIGKVNEKNHSLLWWTLRLADKYPLVPNLCRDTAHFLLVVDLVRSGVEPLIVLTDSVELAGQVEVWGTSQSVSVANFVAHPRTWKVFFRKYTPAGLMNAFARNVLYWRLSHRYKPKRNLTDDHLVIATCTHPRSFVSEECYRDSYFGALVEHKFTQKHKVVIFAWVLERPLHQFKKLRAQNFPVPVVPIEACLTFKTLLACLFRSLYLYVWPLRLNGPTEIDGLDLSYLVKQSMDRSRQSGDFFWGLRINYCVKELARTVRIDRCLYPFENLVREKMLLLGMRSASPQTTMVGYQHAAVSLGHTNFMFLEGEAKINPFPEKILTTGNVTKEWLEREGNYPPGIFKTACGLRQTQPSRSDDPTSNWKRAVRINKVLVVFGSLEEYVSALAFVEKSFSNECQYDVRIRPHPMASLDNALKIAPLARRDFFSTSTDSLTVDLRWADVVLYASSTVAIEALSLGIPVVYMDLGDYLDADPLFGLNEFKWSVSDPTDMSSTIQDIESVPDVQYQELQKKGQRYAWEYLRPVTDSAVRAFLEV